MTNLDNQRPGDLWVLGGDRCEVEAVAPSADGVALTCRTAGGARVTLSVRLLPAGQDGPNDLAALLEYWRAPTGAALAPPGMVELARLNIASLVAEVGDLRARLEEANMLRVETQNPGIDMDAVRASRSAASLAAATPDVDPHP